MQGRLCQDPFMRDTLATESQIAATLSRDTTTAAAVERSLFWMLHLKRTTYLADQDVYHVNVRLAAVLQKLRQADLTYKTQSLRIFLISGM